MPFRNRLIKKLNLITKANGNTISNNTQFKIVSNAKFKLKKVQSEKLC